MHWVRVILKSLALTIVVVGVIAIGYEQIGRLQDRRHFPQIGTSFDVGGRSLNLHCSGSGSPIVILESGMGMPGYSWLLVEQRVTQFARVCWYDRAGYGWSDPGPPPRAAADEARDLHALLKTAGLGPPYILVGHSLGGYNIRTYNGLFPGEVVGFVLVDSSHEDQWDMLPARMRPAEVTPAQRTREDAVLKIFDQSGLSRFWSHIEKPFHGPAQFSARDRETIEYLSIQAKSILAIREERDQLRQSAAEVKASGTLGDRPLIVLTAGSRHPPAGADRPEDFQSFADLWVNQLQPRLAHLSTRGHQIILPNSGHLIPYEDPQAIADAVREVLRNP
jgi:pimeloyl-ACP methyl ester carboxylesterase